MLLRSALALSLALVFAVPASAQHLTTQQALVDVQVDFTEFAVSPDGAHVYAASDFASLGDTEFYLSAFTVEPSGALRLIGFEVENNTTGEVVEISPDGQFVYAAVSGSDAVWIRARDASTGLLTPVAEFSVAANLTRPVDVAISPDGLFAYVTDLTAGSSTTDGVAVYSRDLTTGALSFVSKLDETADPDVGGALRVAFSPDGTQLFLTTRGADPGETGRLVVFARNPATGAITKTQTFTDGVGGVEALKNGTSVAVTPDGTALFIDNSEGVAAIARFSRDPVTGVLTYEGAQRNGQDGFGNIGRNTFVGLHPDGSTLYAATPQGELDDGFLTAATVGPDAALTFLADYGDGEPSTGPSTFVIRPDGSFLYASLTGNISRNADPEEVARIAPYAINGDGSLTAVPNADYAMPQTEEPETVAVAPGGTRVFTSDNAFFDRRPDGTLAYAGTWGGNTLSSREQIAVSPDEHYIYSNSSSPTNQFIFYNVLPDAPPGSTGGNFGGTSETGSGGVTAPIGFLNAFAMSPDGRHLYIENRPRSGSPSTDQLLVVERDATTGDLDLIQVVQQNVGGVDGLNSIFEITLSGDGTLLFVGGALETRFSDYSIAAFTRDPVTGLLTYRDAIGNGGGVTPLDRRVTTITASEDGRRIAMGNGQRVSFGTSSPYGAGLFTYDPTSGTLSYEGDLTPTTAAVSAVQFAQVAGGEALYVNGGDAVLAYEHDPSASGTAAFRLEQTLDADDGLAGADRYLNEARGIGVTADGFVYLPLVTEADGLDLGGIYTFQVTMPIPVELGPVSAVLDGEAVRLAWSTYSETGNAGFAVERAEGDGPLAEIAFVPGAGTTTTEQAYAFRDEALPAAQRLRYRVVQVDLDGARTAGPTVEVTRTLEGLALGVPYPNPAAGLVRVPYTLPTDGPAHLAVYDALGREVFSLLDGPAEAGVYAGALDTSGLAPGVYAVRLTAAGQSQTRLLTVVR